MPHVFISYRTGDEESSATLIDQDLSRRFGTENIFRASKSIPPGADYERELLTAVRRSDVLVPVIGARWLTAVDRQGRRALNNRSDWIRREIAEALACGVTVIPVLVGATNRLRKQDLPPTLAPLANCQYRRFNHRNADADLDRIAEAVATAAPDLVEIDSPSPAEDSAKATNTAHDVSGSVIQARDYTDNRTGGIGNIAGDVGTVVTDSAGPLHTGPGTQVNAPQFHGDGVNNVWGDSSGGNHSRIDKTPRHKDER